MIHAESIDRCAVDEYIRFSLRELVESDWLEWTFEPDYGTEKPETPEVLDLKHFDIDWQRCVVGGGLRDVTPDNGNPTLFLQAIDAVVEEMQKPEYCKYKR